MFCVWSAATAQKQKTNKTTTTGTIDCLTKFGYFSYFFRVRPALVGESAPRGQKVTKMAPFSTPKRSENRVRSLKSHIGQVLKSQKSSQSGLEGRWKVTEAISLKKGGAAALVARFWGYFPKEGEVCLGKLLQFLGSRVASRCLL